jgi:hypothetical protein
MTIEIYYGKKFIIELVRWFGVKDGHLDTETMTDKYAIPGRATATEPQIREWAKEMGYKVFVGYDRDAIYK